ncbi:MAG: iron-sulfur cluster insertion protein ErpA [Halobacteria archaeon]
MIAITEKAATKVKEVMAQEKKNGAGLRVFVSGGGCSGFRYGMSFDEPRADDEVAEQHGVKLIVDANSLRFLKGSSIDWVEDFSGAGFKIENPNATRSCGCGQSFEAQA